MLRLLFLTGLTLMAAGRSFGTDAEVMDTRDCVGISRIARTEIIDGSNILFYLRDGTIYLNTLPRKCPGLRKHEIISYRTSLSWLCKVDTITVLTSTSPGLSRGATCGLGVFRPVTDEQALLMKSEDAPEVDSEQATPAIEEDLENDAESE